MTTPTFTARPVARNVPIWNLFVDGYDFGTMSDLPMETGPMATIRAGGQEVTLKGATIAEVLGMVKVSYTLLEAEAEAAEDRHWLGMAEAEAEAADLEINAILRAALCDDAPDEEPIEDEDGTLAAMRAAERLAEVWAERDPTYGFPEYH